MSGSVGVRKHRTVCSQESVRERPCMRRVQGHDNLEWSTPECAHELLSAWKLKSAEIWKCHRARVLERLAWEHVVARTSNSLTCFMRIHGSVKMKKHKRMRWRQGSTEQDR